VLFDWTPTITNRLSGKVTGCGGATDRDAAHLCQSVDRSPGVDVVLVLERTAIPSNGPPYAKARWEKAAIVKHSLRRAL
jgi:hypothetical protein